MQSTIKDNVQLWRKQLEEARAYRGSVSAYCRSKKISISKYYYWRGKLRSQNESVSAEAVTPGFAQVEVTAETQNNLPDPRWIAELIRQLQVGGGR